MIVSTKKNLVRAIAISCGIALLFFACSKSGSDAGPTSPPAAGDTALNNVAVNTIIPAYQQLATASASLDVSAAAFASAPGLRSLQAVQTDFKAAYTAWAGVSELEFGPATDALLTTHFLNSFPTDTVTIRNNINGAVYAIDGLGNFAAQGFPAIDYLLFANGNDAVIDRFSGDEHAAGARAYLLALTATIRKKANAVAVAWPASGGNYLATFVKGTGTDAGSSLSLLVNAYVLDFDVNLQNFKFGIPIGLYGPSVLPKSPAKVEAYYSGLSIDLLLAQTKTFQRLYASFLQSKVAAAAVEQNGKDLSVVISNEWTTLAAAFQALPGSLPDAIVAADPSVMHAYTEIRKTTVLLKVDMSSALGIKISFQDDDGD